MAHDESDRGENTSSTRKRKPNRVVIYGYDPGIATIPGDPRLEPPPSWFGVNYHKSQPVSNSWQEWYGDRSAMFDIAKNRIVPVSNESQIAKESSKRRKPNSYPQNIPMPLPFPFFSMMWHPAQPVRNEWQDWGDQPMMFMQSMAQMQEMQKKLQAKPGNNTASFPANQTSSATPTVPPASPWPTIPAPALFPANNNFSEKRNGNDSTQGSGETNSNTTTNFIPAVPTVGGAPGLKPLIPVKPVTDETASATMQALLKDKEAKANAAAARARALAKQNRLRKERYVKVAENHVKHLEELRQVTLLFLHQLRSQHSRIRSTPTALSPMHQQNKQGGVANAAAHSTLTPPQQHYQTGSPPAPPKSLNRQSSAPLRLSTKATQLLRSAFLGNSTVLPASHEYCAHEQLKFAELLEQNEKIQKARRGSKAIGNESISTISIPLEERRLEYLISLGPQERLSRLRGSLVGVARSVEKLVVANASTSILLHGAVLNSRRSSHVIDEDAVPRMRAMSLTDDAHQDAFYFATRDTERNELEFHALGTSNSSILSSRGNENQDVTNLAQDLLQTLNLSPQQLTQVQQLMQPSTNRVKNQISLAAFHKVLRTISPIGIRPAIVEDQQVLAGLLNEKQRKKLLRKLAEKNLSDEKVVFPGEKL